MNISTTRCNKQRGFTLVELMVAATLGLLVLGGAISMFVSNKRVYTEQDEMGRLQENARFALDMMVRDIRMAGYAGCADDVGSVTNHVVNSANAANINSFVALEGYEADTANWVPSASGDQVANMTAGSDAITVRYFEPTDIYVVNPFMAPGASQIFVTSGHGLQQGDIVSIADCDRADIVVITNIPTAPTPAGCNSQNNPACSSTINHLAGAIVNAAPGNSAPTLSKAYNQDAQIHRYYTARYFVGTTNGNPVLRRMAGIDPTTTANTPVVDDVVEGVENLQILYGEDTDDDDIADNYRTAATVGDWNNVSSVRLALLMRTVVEYGSDVDSDTYDLLGSPINPTDDRRRRRVFSTTVQIRNRSN